MKPYTLPVKRTPVSKGILKRLSAVTRSRRQRVAATAMPGDFEDGDQSSKISRALTIIFLIHIVGIGLVFFHRQYLGDDKTSASSSSSSATTATALAPVAPGPKLSSGDVAYRVKPGDNYVKIAAAYGVDENDLRTANDNVEITASRLLRIPPKRIVAVPPAAVTEMIQNTIPDTDRGLVEAVPVADAPRAQIVKPAIAPPATAPQTAPKVVSAPKPTPAIKPATLPKATETAAATTSGRTYVVKSGDSVYRIASRFAVDQKALMKANGIKDPTKLKLGSTLNIPR